MILSLTINQTLKCLSSLPILMQESFWWRRCSDRYIISLSPHLHTPVDVKHHAYLLVSSGRKSRPLSSSLPDSVTIGSASVHMSDSVKNLGVTLDCHLACIDLKSGTLSQF